MSFDYWFGIVLTVGLTAYLLFALVRPEEF
jgi:K+-transporting ATPase KdpF subunit